MTEDLSSRILAAIDETEKIATIADDRSGLPPTTWITELSRSGKWRILREADDMEPIGYISDGRWEDQHIVRHDPAAVLRRCAADRKILAHCASAITATAVSSPDCFSLAEWVLDRLADAYGIQDPA